jgi:DNA-binding CsgD family transcriptional regulator
MARTASSTTAVASISGVSVEPRILNKQTAIECAVQCAASVFGAETTLTYLVTPNLEIEVVRCAPPDFTTSFTREPVGSPTGTALLGLSLDPEVRRVCGRKSPFVKLGAKPGGGFLSIPLAAESAHRVCVCGALILARNVPCIFVSKNETFVGLLSSLCRIVVRWRESPRSPDFGSTINNASDKSGPFGNQSVMARDRNVSLSYRESQVSECLANDLSCKEIASLLGMSTRTVEHYVERLKLKAGASTLHGLVAFLVRENYCRST